VTRLEHREDFTMKKEMDTATEPRKRKTDPKAVIVLIILVFFTIFLLQNMTPVDVQFLFWKATTSRAVILLVTLFIGCLAGLLLGWKLFRKKAKS
jgi:uncharacterized integral membrane protein